MNKLVEGMLAVGSWFPPHNGTSGVVHTNSSTRHTLAIRLHVSLHTAEYRSSKGQVYGQCAVDYYSTVMYYNSANTYLLEVGSKTMQVLQT